jgi:hypothetical protein
LGITFPAGMSSGGGCMTQSLTERYDERIGGVLSCYDRVVITGTVPVICYAEGMTRFLHAAGIRTSTTHSSR